MSQQNKLMGVGQSAASAAQIVGDVASGLTAAGTGQSTALALSCACNYVETVASGTGVRLYGMTGRPSSIGDEQTVYNTGANALSVYPPSGEQIVGAAQDAAFSVPAGVAVTFKKVKNTLWLVVSGDAAFERFVQSGTGAVSTAVQTELRRIWYPEQFGALGDGTTDDAAAWALVIAAAGSSNAEIRGTPGKTYLIGAAGIALTSKTNVWLVGNGAKFKIGAVSSQAMGGFSTVSIVFSSCIGSGFVNWSVDGNSKATSAVGFSGCTGCVFDNNTMTAGGGNAQIVAINNTGNRYTNNTISASSGSARGMWIGNTNASEPENDFVIANNHVFNNAATGIGGVWACGTITGNVCTGNAGSGITAAASGSQYSKNVAITGNYCRGNTFQGIQSDSSTNADFTDGLTISGNVCEGNITGIYCVRAKNWSITGNVCRDNTDSGILVDVASQIAITGNNCHDSRSGGSRTQIFGISILSQNIVSGIADIMVSGNSCCNHTTTGIRVQTTTPGTLSNVSITGNYTATNGSRGITVIPDVGGAITGVRVFGNKSVNNTTSAYRIDTLDEDVWNGDTTDKLKDLLINGGANAQQLRLKSLTELTTVAAAATTDTAIQIPVNAVVFAVSVRVTTVIPTAATFTVTGTTSGTQFDVAAGVSVAANTTDVGTRNCPFKNGAAQTIRITPNLSPGANTGRVRVTIHYYDIVPPTS